MSNEATKCIGVLGRLLGHKFFKAVYDQPLPNCARCGAPYYREADHG